MIKNVELNYAHVSNIYKRLKYVYQNVFGKNIYHNDHIATKYSPLRIITNYNYQLILFGFPYYPYNSIGNDTSLSVMNIIMKETKSI